MTRQLQRWGVWHVGRESGTLEFEERDPFFDLRGVTCAADVVAKIFDINNQPWASPRAMKDLLRAFDYLLDPQNDFRAKQSFEPDDGT